MSSGKAEYWRKLIAEQESGGQKVGPFCRERGITEASFYYWRKRLRKGASVQFALLEARQTDSDSTTCAFELVLTSGERLRIGSEVDAAALRMVLEIVRG